MENLSVAQRKQKKLIGKGAEERGKLVEKVAHDVKSAIFKGEKWDLGVWEEAVRELCKDISKERARLGGDWAIATVITSRSLRDFVRLAHPTFYGYKDLRMFWMNVNALFAHVSEKHILLGTLSVIWFLFGGIPIY